MKGVFSIVILAASCFVVTQQMTLQHGVCTDWVDLVWKLMVLDETKQDASRSDMDRLIIFIDNDGDGQLGAAEFNSVWECTMMTHEDTARVFQFMANKADDNQRDMITSADVDVLWRDTFNKANRNGITRNQFISAWTAIAATLPDKGCYDPAEHTDGYMSELCTILTEGGF